jgi:hypothetical protein
MKGNSNFRRTKCEVRVIQDVCTRDLNDMLVLAELAILTFLGLYDLQCIT